MSKRFPNFLLVLIASLVVLLNVLMLASGFGFADRILVKFGIIEDGYRVGTWAAILLQFLLNGIAVTLAFTSQLKAAKSRNDAANLQFQVSRLRDAVERLDSSCRKNRADLREIKVSFAQTGVENANLGEEVNSSCVQVLSGEERKERDYPYKGDQLDPGPKTESQSEVIIRSEIENLFLDLCQRCEKGRELIERFRQGVVQAFPEAMVFSVFRDGGVGWSSFDFTKDGSTLRAPLEYLVASDASGVHWLFPCPHKAGFNFADLTGFKVEGGDQNDRRKLRAFCAVRLKRMQDNSFSIADDNGEKGFMAFG